METDRFPEGVRPLDHTADIGMDVRAPSLAELFHAAAAGLVAFTCPRRDGVPTHAWERVQLEADDAALLLVAWLRELLYRMDTRQLCYVNAEFTEIGAQRLAARVGLAHCAAAIREIKGVTYHDLDVHREGTEWRARVIFDV